MSYIFKYIQLTVAIKKFQYEIDYEDISKELCILQDIQHPHIVHFIGIVIDTDNSLMFVSEFTRITWKVLYQNS